MMRDRTQDSTTEGESQEAANFNLDHNTIAALAYQLWMLRARPIGSPEVDWFRAEQELKHAATAVPRAA